MAETKKCAHRHVECLASELQRRVLSGGSTVRVVSLWWLSLVMAVTAALTAFDCTIVHMLILEVSHPYLELLGC